MIYENYAIYWSIQRNQDMHMLAMCKADLYAMIAHVVWACVELVREIFKVLELSHFLDVH